MKTSAFRLTAGSCFKYFLDYNLFNFFCSLRDFCDCYWFPQKIPYLCFLYDNFVFLGCKAEKYGSITLESCLLILLFLNFAPKESFSFRNRSSTTTKMSNLTKSCRNRSRQNWTKPSESWEKYFF